MTTNSYERNHNYEIGFEISVQNAIPFAGGPYSLDADKGKQSREDWESRHQMAARLSVSSLAKTQKLIRQMPVACFAIHS